MLAISPSTRKRGHANDSRLGSHPPRWTIPSINAPMASLSLQSPRWNPPTRAALNSALARWSTAADNGAAVFDFDNTCIFHDFGDAVFREQLRRFHFALHPDAFAEHLPRAVGDCTRLASGDDLASLADQLAPLYARLHSLAASNTSDAAALNTFSSLLAALYVGLEATPQIGARVAYPWVCGLLGGFRDEDVQALAHSAWNQSVTEPIGWTTFDAEGATPTTMRTGIRALVEVRELFGALRAAGVECFIVTASERTVVQTIAPSIGLDIEPENIFGMRLAIDDAGRRKTSLAPSAVPTYREGKRQTIENEIVSRGLSPLLVAGDSDTDFEMLDAFPNALRLVVHRTDAGDIATLYDSERTFLQGRDERVGHFIPQARSILLDKAAS